MNETVFKELLGESLQREYAEFDNAPEHRFSFRNRLAMKRIFARYEKNIHGLKTAKAAYTPFQSEDMPSHTIKQRVMYALVIIIIMAMLMGCVIPVRGITDARIDRLRSRYDFPNMKTTICIESNFTGNPNCPWAGLFMESEEYVSFLADLVDMGLYTENEMETIKLKPSPIDTRPKPRNSEIFLTPVAVKIGGQSPLESYRDFVARLEEQIEYYRDRAKDPSQAVEGDTEFAELIAERYLPLPKSFLELLEKLYADVPDNEDEKQNNRLADLDKDDRKYLCEINEI